MRTLLAGVAAATILAVAPAAMASGQHPKLTEIEGDYMCLLCRVPLDESNSPAANQERAVLRRLIAQGLTASEIKDRMVADYGSNVLAAPPDSGFNILAWWLPIVGILAGAAAIGYVVWRWSRRRPGDPPDGPPSTPLEPDVEEQLDRELARFEA